MDILISLTTYWLTIMAQFPIQDNPYEHVAYMKAALFISLLVIWFISQKASISQIIL